MSQSVKVKKTEAWPLVSKTFPDYTGRKFKVKFAEKLTFWDTNWDGGSRNVYAAVSIDGRTGRFSAPAPWVNPLEGKIVELSPSFAVVEHSTFCGHDMGITIHLHPSHAPKWLSAGK